MKLKNLILCGIFILFCSCKGTMDFPVDKIPQEFTLYNNLIKGKSVEQNIKTNKAFRDFFITKQHGWEYNKFGNLVAYGSFFQLYSDDLKIRVIGERASVKKNKKRIILEAIFDKKSIWKEVDISINEFEKLCIE